MYHTEPPTDKKIREWYMNYSRVAACALRNEQAATVLEFMYHSRIVLSVGGSVWYMIRNLRCTVTIDSVLANSKTQNAFLFTLNAIFLHDYPLFVSQRTGSQSAGIHVPFTNFFVCRWFCVVHDPKPPFALSQLTQFWQIPRNRTFFYSL